MVKSPFSCAIFPLTQPQVANQQQQKICHLLRVKPGLSYNERFLMDTKEP